MHQPRDKQASMHNVGHGMELRHIEAFAAVVAAGSMMGAGRTLSRSQSAVSRLIQELEGEVGFALFHRNGPRITPTDRGLRFYAEAERLLSSFGEMRNRARLIAADRPRSIVIATVAATAMFALPTALRERADALSRTQVSIQTLTADRVLAELLAGVADLGLASLPLKHPEIEPAALFEAPCEAIVACEHPLAQATDVSLTDLRGYPLVTLANPNRLRRHVDEALARAGVVPESVYSTNTSTNALLLAQAGLGVAVIDPLTANGLDLPTIRRLAIAEAIPYRWGIFMRRGRPQAAETTQLVDAVKRIAVDQLPGARLVAEDETDGERTFASEVS